jgi:hypothetical protein
VTLIPQAAAAGVGRSTFCVSDDPVEVVMASTQSKPDFDREWS